MTNIQFPSAKRKLLLLTTIIVLNTLAFTINTKGFYGNLYFFSGAFVWLPVLLCYIFMFFWNHKKYFEFTFYKLFGFLICDALILIQRYLFISHETAFFLAEVYQIFGIPFQVTMILIIDTIGKFANKKAS